MGFLGRIFNVVVALYCAGGAACDTPKVFTEDSYKAMGSPEHLVIAEGYTAVDCFFGDDRMKTISFPRSMRNMNGSAMFDCLSLDRIELYDTFIEFSTRAFYCSSVKDIVVLGANSDSRIVVDGGVLYNRDRSEVLMVLNCNERLVLPNTVRKIGPAAFSQCPDLESVELPESLEEIGACAFRDTSIKSLVIPKSVKKVGDSAFSDSLLESVVFLNEDAEFGEYIFMKCMNLRYTNLPHLREM